MTWEEDSLGVEDVFPSQRFVSQKNIVHML
jgi:hypothetical protein